MAKEAQIRVDPSSLVLSLARPTYTGVIEPVDFIPEPAPEPPEPLIGGGEVMLIGAYNIPAKDRGFFGPTGTFIPVYSSYEWGAVQGPLGAGKLLEVRFHIVAVTQQPMNEGIWLFTLRNGERLAGWDMGLGGGNPYDDVRSGSLDWAATDLISFEILNYGVNNFDYTLSGSLLFVPTLPPARA